MHTRDYRSVLKRKVIGTSYSTERNKPDTKTTTNR